jgi:hypothetical protein
MVGSSADLTAAGDGNRARTISLGIGHIKPARTVDQATYCPGVTLIDPPSPWLIAR